MRQTTDDRELARRWACDARTIRRWRKDRAPLDDDNRMREWLSGRKNLPPGTIRLLGKRTPAKVNAIEMDAVGDAGAGPALARLESTELKLFDTLQSALAAGDPFAIRTARDSWLRVSAELRRYDLQVERERRVRQEMLPRGDVEQLLYQCGRLLHFSLTHQPRETLLLAMANRPATELANVVRDWLENRAWAGLVMGYISPHTLPPWCLDKLSAGLMNGQFSPAVQEAKEQNVKLAERALAEVTKMLADMGDGRVVEQHATHAAKP